MTQTDSPIKSLCVAHHPDRPETETFIGLAALGFRIRVLCAPDAPNFERLRASQVSVAPLEITHRIERSAVAAIKREIERMHPNILHLIDNKPVLNGIMAARGFDLRIIAYRGIVGNISYFNPSAWLRFLNPRVDRIICVAEAVRRSLADVHCLGLRIPPEKLVTIYKGHDLSWYDFEPIELESIGIPRDAFVVGCVANWRPRKGVEVLIRACRHLPPSLPIHVVLVGRNMQNVKLVNEIAASPWRDRIHLLGFRADAAAIAAAFDVAVLPALRREGLPKTIIEAMANSVPPIVTAVGGSPELVVDGESGLVVPPADSRALAAAIVKLYESEALRKRLGEAARERIRSAFPIGATIRQTAELYRSLVQP